MSDIFSAKIIEQKKASSRNERTVISCVRFYAVVLLCLISLVLTVKDVHSVTRINIDSGQNDPIPVALHPFQSQGDRITDGIRDEIYQITVEDLESTDLFQFASRGLFLRTLSFADEPNFKYWNNLDYTVFVNAEITRSGSQIEANVKIWNTALEKLDLQDTLRCKANDKRKLAHKISDFIYAHFTGEKGYFNSRIAFVSEFGPKTNMKKRISVVDYDGKNLMDLTDGRFLALTPRFAPNENYVMYVSYENRIPKVYLQKIEPYSKKKLVGEFQGMSFAPRFHPNGESGIMSISSDEGTHLYQINFTNNKLRRLTWGKDHIDTSPSYSPDGSKIVYSSDRSGSLQLYVMNLKTGKSKKISFGGGGYAAPEWSPKGDLIAFTKFQGGQFHIGVVKPDGGGERLLTASWMDDSPTWSPNGRAIMFAREEQEQDSALYIVDVTSGRTRRFNLGIAASSPCWDYNHG